MTKINLIHYYVRSQKDKPHMIQYHVINKEKVTVFKLIGESNDAIKWSSILHWGKIKTAVFV